MRCAQEWERLQRGWDPKQGIPLGFPFPITEMSLPWGHHADLVALPGAPKPPGSLQSGMTTPQGIMSPQKGVDVRQPQLETSGITEKITFKSIISLYQGF